MVQIEYTKKPSKPTLLAAICKALAAGETWLQLTWGENQITIERGPYGLTGQGWIGRHGGHDLAAALAAAERNRRLATLDYPEHELAAIRSALAATRCAA
jgi:hypothetical protein